jgi:uncharacterized protein (DUF58 family)
MSGRARRSAANGRVTLQARRALVTAVTGLALVLAAFVFDAAPLFVCGIAVFGVGASAPLWVLVSVRGTRARRVLTADRVVEDQPLRAAIEVRRPLSSWGWGRLEIVDPLTRSALRLGGASSPVRHARIARVELVTSFATRGEHRLTPPRIIARDPLELARAQTLGQGESQLVLVLPRVSPVRWLGSERSRRLAGEGGDRRAEAMAASELHGLRPYRPGTPASRIHWPALARGHGLIERRLHADGDERPLVVLDTRVRGSGVHRDLHGLDAAVRAAASLVLDLARHGGCGVLLPGQARATMVDGELASWPAIHACLATAGTDADAHRTHPPALQRLSGRRGPLIYVAAISHQRLATALSATGAGGRQATVLVVPDTELVEGRPRGAGTRAVPTLAVSGCRGFALGTPREEHRRPSSDAVGERP